MLARCGLVEKKTCWPHLGPFQAFFPWAGNMYKKIYFFYFPWWANGPHSPGLGQRSPWPCTRLPRGLLPKNPGLDATHTRCHHGDIQGAQQNSMPINQNTPNPIGKWDLVRKSSFLSTALKISTLLPLAYHGFCDTHDPISLNLTAISPDPC